MPIWLPVVSKFDPKGVEDAQRQLKKFGDNLALGVTAAFAGAAFAAVNFGKDAISAAESVAVADNRVKNIADSMGLFGDQAQTVAGRLITLAEAQEGLLGVDAELIKAGQAQLLTFKGVAASADEAGGAFDRATFAAIDLAAAGFGSIDSASIMLGKALQDPVKGLTALGRAGVTFTESEKELIKTLVESGKTLEAQEMILKAVETQVGGTAAATATASDKLALAFENIYEEVGKALLPVLDDLLPILTELAEEIGKNLVNALKEVDFKSLIKGVSDFTTYIIKNFDTIVEWAKNIAIGAGAFVALKTAIDVARVASVLFAASPIGALVAALGLLAGAAYLAADAQQHQANSMTEAEKVFETNAQKIAFLKQEQEKYNNLVNRGGIESSYYAGKLEEVTTQLTALEEEQKLAIEPVTNLNTSFGTMNLTLDNAYTKMMFMKNATGDAERELKLFNDQLAINRGGLEGISTNLDNAKIKIDFFKTATQQANREMERFIEYAKRMKAAADTINALRIPSVGQIVNPGQSPIPMAEGGIVLPRPGGTLAQIGEAGKAEAVIPLDRLAGMGGNNYSITINAGVGSDPVAIGRYVTEAIKKYERVSGKVFANA
jgi:hypothetical protein